MTHTRAWLRNNNNIVNWLLLAVMLLVMAPVLVIPYAYYDLKSVQVSPVGTGFYVTADRSIRQDFQGKYSVAVLREDHSAVCHYKTPEWLGYRANAGDTNPLVKPLWWWIGSDAALENCINRGFHSGQFYIETCHWAQFWIIPMGPRCVLSNLFEVPKHEALQ